MTSLASMLPDFRSLIPSKEIRRKSDEAAKEWENQERQRKIRSRIAASGIPDEYADADISLCDERVKRWCDGVLKGKKWNLVLQGKVGRGKTYSACASLRYLAQAKPILFTSYETVLLELKACFDGHESEQTIINRYSSVPYLCMDDFGKSKPTEWALTNLFNILNARYNSGKSTIFTTQYCGDALLKRFVIPGDSEYAKAIFSRLGNFLQVYLDGPDRRLA